MSRFCFVFLALFLLSVTIASGAEDPELRQCKHQCRAQKQFDERQRERCIQSCEEYSREKGQRGREQQDSWNRESPIERLRECSRRCEQQEREPQQRDQCRRRCQEQYEQERERERGHQDSLNRESPIERLRECSRRCEQQERGEQQREQCHRRCQEQYEQERGRYEDAIMEREKEEWGGARGEEQEERNPYVFGDRHFFTGMKTEHGRLRILRRFSERSRLLRGLENYRVMILEADPQTFVVPNHWDADSIAFVARGRGTISMIHQDKRESFNIRQGDIFRVRAGTTAYLVNRDNNEKLVLAKLLQPVNTPGEFEAFFGAGGQNPESFYNTFSDEILEAAFNTKRDRLQRIFKQQQQGVIIKARPEQIRSMGRHEEGGIWPFGGESKGTYNLYQQRPTQSNQYGQLYEVDASEFRQLRDLDVSVSLANITRGAMTAPYYDSKATKITMVVDGNGYFEMACPHLSKSSQQEQERGPSRGPSGPRGYERVSSRLSKGTVVVVPAGHPFVAVASQDQNLQLLCFEVHAYNNQKYTLAGRRNVMNELENEAKELAFGVPAREVDEVFRSQQEEFFFKGPRQGRAQE